jgi:hypothetical protein
VRENDSEDFSVERVIVESSNIASVGYDADTSTLEVEFLNGAVYQYFEVSEDLYHDMLRASSPGSYLNQYVKHAYSYSQV